MQESVIHAKRENGVAIRGYFMKIFNSLGLSTTNMPRDNRLREVDELYRTGRINNDEMAFARMLILDEF
jgi:hypothetical protein